MASIDILLPVFKPSDGWHKIIIDRFNEIKRSFPDDSFRLLIVNDGTPELDQRTELQQLQSNIPELVWLSYTTNRGKGYALRYGVSHTRAELIVYTDIDWPYTHKSVVDVISLLKSGSDAVIGIRNNEYYRNLPRYRRIISKSLRAVNGLLLRLKVSDTQAGLKGFSSSLSPIFMQTTIDRYLFDLEFIYRISRERNLKISACPIELRDGIVFSKMNRKILMEEARNFLKVWIGS